MIPRASDGDKIICSLHQIPLEELANRSVTHGSAVSELPANHSIKLVRFLAAKRLPLGAASGDAAFAFRRKGKSEAPRNNKIKLDQATQILAP